MRKTIMLICFVMFLTAVPAMAARIVDGYAGLKWGTNFHDVMKMYKKGEMAEFGGEMIYKQVKPNKIIARRLFGFKKGKLNSVNVTFTADYVKKVGLENVLAEHVKSYGQGKMDNAQAPHMLFYTWEGKNTRIRFIYAPKRPDMTALMYEQK
ncbi:MAG: hypothetical protein HYS23_14690 [Geobacter sp.]|nr:hypothetical protein [Geobacter sp.]